ncbi:lipase family protein [Agaribacter flavus]|uniref:Lipase n=1 Tax=Agaribacter flavus TaxID=1902781 RepID=A0ABV7FQD4_9ALTE
MKRLKRYQYERYAILCQLAYPDTPNTYKNVISPFHQIQLTDKYGRMSVRLLWQDDKKEVIIVFRGSLGLKDWLGNCCCFPSKLNVYNDSYNVHWGFKRLLDAPLYPSSISPDGKLHSLRQVLYHSLTPLLKQGKRFSFIGHSSGGAVAVLMADYYERVHPKSVKRVVTFGQPAAGSLSFRRKYKLHNRTYRICCDLDMITYLPPIPYYFWHVGKMLWLHDEQIYENTPTLQRLSMSLKSWLLRPITYHYMRKYIRNKSLFDEH